MSENDMTTPFLIIGAGIGGLYLANLLKKQKKRVLAY